mmetsp:Transcript_146221/g.207316  ORF Transcript_146221/g.207316 Transcript_146221/m.207316 type:complete len:396 (-) Transcript_146221:54-1241(-)
MVSPARNNNDWKLVCSASTLCLVVLTFASIGVLPVHTQRPSITADQSSLRLSANDVVFAQTGARQQSLRELIANVTSTSTTVSSLPTLSTVQAAVSNAVTGLATTSSVTAVSTSVATAFATASSNSQLIASLSSIVANQSLVNSLSTTVSQLVGLAGSTYGQSPASNPQTCRDLQLAASQAGIYTLWPSGAQGASVQAYCAALASPVSLIPSLHADWTLIISDVNGTYPSNLQTLYTSTPTPNINGALQAFLRSDLRTLGSELFVMNNAGQGHIFQLSEFTGPIRIDGPNFCASDVHPGHGLVAGNSHPVVFHFQIGQACSTPGCYVTTPCRLPCGGGGGRCCQDRAQRYSSPVFALFDWDWTDGQANRDFHASFGATNLTRAVWSHQGTLLAIR